MFGRLFNNRYGATVLGVVAVSIGLFGFDSNEVKCGARTMTASDQCIETRKGNSTTRSYEEQKSQDRLARFGFLGVGAALFIGGTGLIVKKHVLDPKRGDSAVAGAGEPPQPSAGEPPQQAVRPGSYQG
jgi:hypothetical protein